MLRKLGKILSLLLLLGLAPVLARATTAPLILAINYQSPQTVPFIGSTITVYMTAIQPTQSIAVTVSSTAGNQVVLTGPAFATMPNGTQLFVTDGVHVWSFGFSAPSNFITLNSGNQLDGAVMAAVAGEPFYIANYNNLANNTFSVYTGSLITGTSPGSPNFSVELGADFANVALNDSGLAGGQGDNVAGDGIWTAVYTVSNLGYNVSNGRFFGNASISGVSAVNQPYQSSVAFNIDGVLPAIVSKEFTTTAGNYNSMLYLARSSQTFSHVSNFNPNNQQGTFSFTTNENDVTVNIQIVGSTNWPLGAPPSLPPINIPTSAVNPIGTAVWDGSDANGNYVSDGVYTANLYIGDINGLSGVTQTIQVRVVSAEWSIGNITLNPSALDVNTGLTNGDIITNVSYNANLFTDNATSLRSSLEVMHWDNVGAGQSFGDPTHTLSGLWAVNDMAFLNPDGSVGISVNTESDDDPTNDDDVNYVELTKCDSTTIDPETGGSMADGSMLTCGYDGDHTGVCTTHNPSIVARVGDGNTDNDWTPNSFQEFTLWSSGSGFGAQTDPTLATVTFTVQVLGNIPSANNYRLQLRTTLCALNFYNLPYSTAPALQDYCANPPNTVPFYNDRPFHFFPSQRPDSPGVAGTLQGLGLNTSDSSVMFTVGNTPPITGDQSPPSVIATSPQQGASNVVAGTYGPGTPLQAQIQDVGSNLILDNAHTFITLSYINPTGGKVVVGGTVSSNGGGNNLYTVFFTPSQVLNVGASYTMTIQATDQAGLSVNDQVLFTVQDTTAPSVSEVQLFCTGCSSPIQLTSFQTVPDGPFSGITEIQAQLSIPTTSQNIINYQASTISLYQVSGTAQSPVNLVNQVTVFPPSNGMLDYKISPPITNAGLFLIKIQTFSQNSTGSSFTGPPSSSAFTSPEFTTIVNSNAFTVNYNGGSILALGGVVPITGLTNGGSSFSVSTATVGVANVNFGSLPSNTGEIPLSNTASSASSMQVVASGVAQTGPITWTIGAGSSLAGNLEFQSSELPAGIQANQVTLWQFNGSVWQAYSGSGTPSYGVTSSTQTNATSTFPVNFNSGVAEPAIYALFYPSTNPSIVAQATATPLGFKATRSFNPNNANAVYRKAKFYYASNAVQDVQVHIYDTAGQLVRSLGTNNGVNLGAFDTDPTSGATGYYFQWDGNNDGGSLVKNGIYLVRYQVTDNSGNVSSQTKLVALIK